MKKIGIIGGMSWESSLQYYKLANEMVKQKLGGFHSCKCVMSSVDFAEIETLQHAGKWEELGRMMVMEALTLEKAGAELLLIATNTMHKMAPEVQAAVSIPLLHIADAAALAAKAMNMKKVALLGTRFTMEQDFYKNRMIDEYGLEVIVPRKEDRDSIHRIIYDELVMGVIKKESEQIFQKIIESLGYDGAQGVVLGCTEIPLLINHQNSPLPVFDTTYLHVQMAVELALNQY